MNFANKNNEQILKEIVKRWQDSDIHFVNYQNGPKIYNFKINIEQPKLNIYYKDYLKNMNIIVSIPAEFKRLFKYRKFRCQKHAVLSLERMEL